MKHIIGQAFFLVTLFFVFISCGNKDAQPNSSTVLKTLTEESSSSLGMSITKISLEYSENILVKTISINENDWGNLKSKKEVKESYSYKDNLINTVYSERLDNATNLTVKDDYIYDITKTDKGFDVIQKRGNTKSYLVVEINSNDQLTKTINTKSVSISLTGSSIETTNNSYRRCEYDLNGNIIKEFSSIKGQKEYLFMELTYDSNPNPFANLRKVSGGRIKDCEGFGFGGESNNNPLRIKRYNSVGILNDDYTITYTYDRITNLPLTSIWTNKLPTSQTVSSTLKYTFSY